MFRRTKIVATLGPATDEPGVLEDLILAGVNVVRMNFSHGGPEDHQQRASLVREYSKKHGKFVAILGDLQGPKIRVARFAEGPIQLNVGDSFALDASLERDAGNQSEVGIDYKELPNDVSEGDLLLLDDGRVVLKVVSIAGTRVETVVTVAGKLSNNKGINRQGGGLTAPALTDKDKADIKTAVQIGVDYLAVSFPRSAEDMNLARSLAAEAGGDLKMVAKIERAEAVAEDETLDAIILASDAVMVARGDLGVEIGDAELIGVQKHIIARARSLNRGVITATQMMETMISSPLPTRAEVFDVANAVLDGTDAVMLSAETAAGQFPVQTVEAMVRVILGAEQHPESVSRPKRAEGYYQRIDESIAMATMYTANALQNVKAIATLTETGSSPLMMSRFGARMPIFAFSNHESTLRRSALFRGVEPILLPPEFATAIDLKEWIVAQLKERNVLSDGDFLMMSKGDKNTNGATNTMKILQIGEPILG